MTETVWDGSASTDWGTAANWSNGIGNDYHCILPDMSSISNKPTLTGDISVGSIRAVTNSEIVGGGYQITCSLEGTTGEGFEGYAASFDGTITGVLSLKITTAGFTYLDLVAPSGNIHDLEINHSGGDYKALVGDTTLTGTLWIKDGNLKMNGDSNTLSVTEDIKLGDGSDAGFFGHDDHDGAIDARSLAIVTAGSTFTSTEGVLTLDGENASGFAFDNDGVFVHNSGTVTITTQDTTTLDTVGASGNQFHHLTINHASCNAHYSGHTTVAGNLTITAGELTCSNAAGTFTVTGHTEIGDGTGSSTEATLTCGDATMSLGASHTSSYAIIINQAGFFNGGSGNHTIGSFDVKNNSNAKCTLTSGVTTISSERTSDNKAIQISTNSTFSHGNGTVTHTLSANTRYQRDGGIAVALNNFIQNNNSNLQVDPALTCAGDFTLTAGEFDTSGSDYGLTVTGYCDVTGTLTLNGSTVSVAALRCKSGAAVTQDSDGTLALATGSNFGGTEGSAYSLRNIDGTSDINLGGTTTVTGGSYFEPRTATVYASVLNNIVWDSGQYWVGEIKIGGTLVVNAAKHMQPYGGSKNVTVDGNVTLAGQLTAHPNGHSDLDTMSFGSLTINSGGAYHATTGTTIITNRTSGGYSWYAPTTGSTFTHNNGLVKLTYQSNETYWQGTGFYDLEIAGHTAHEHRYDDLTDGSGLTIFNNFTITEGRVRFNQAGDSVTVHGLAKMTGGQYGNTGSAPSGTHNYNGGITVTAGSWQTTSGTLNTSSLRVVGGTFA